MDNFRYKTTAIRSNLSFGIQKYIVIFLLIFSPLKYAISDEDLSLCKPTEQEVIDFSGKIDMSYNDLTAKRWMDFDNNFSSKVLIKGMLLDSNCVPVPDAFINVWNSNDKEGPKNYYSGGETYSNNLGRFNFFVTPNTMCKDGDLMNVIVSHPNFKNLKTKLHIKNCSSNGDKTMILIMDGKNRFLKY